MASYVVIERQVISVESIEAEEALSELAKHIQTASPHSSSSTTTMPSDNEEPVVKRDLEDSDAPDSPNKKAKTETDAATSDIVGTVESLAANKGEDGHAFVPEGKVGVTTINDNDVLSG